MNKLLIFLLSISLLACSDKGDNMTSEPEEGIVISGRITNPANGIVTIEEILADKLVPVDTIELADDFTFNHTFTGSPGFYRVNFFNAQTITVILDQDDISIVADGGNPRGQYEVTGSSDIDMIRKFNQDLSKVFSERERQLNQAYVEARNANDHAKANAIQQQFMDLVVEKEQYTIKALDMMGPRLATFQLVNSLDKDRNYKFINKIALELDEKYPDKYYIEDLIDKMELVKVTSVGNPAPEIALPNPDGEVVPLSSLKGKVVLIDFWAEWCRPCRQENPNVVKAYNKYKDKGFTVYGVSLDRTKDKWVKAIKDDGLTWTHVSDLKYFNSEAAQDYGVQAIPFSLLVDRDGIIVAKNLRGAALEQELESYFEEESL